ncbi:hypothetical protein K0M31_014961 [Melipona bicolor]|uniref:Uncharacterized protein n=1 Tax=Melipona bicolor TaxID=60889 RepID=A0AA40KFQ5_9HYME|nr:hypothetical protein K0M31_014961 [Melipona bicolor]
MEKEIFSLLPQGPGQSFAAKDDRTSERDSSGGETDRENYNFNHKLRQLAGAGTVCGTYKYNVLATKTARTSEYGKQTVQKPTDRRTMLLTTSKTTDCSTTSPTPISHHREHRSWSHTEIHRHKNPQLILGARVICQT